ncbi:pleckstrin domain-containing protein [Cavenderia fasciculata]|uniref:Pleckstrin domain-containing protein n=1 Tax=Cavenderia fasciculata TaxID=261658 RepID=F4PJX3_CACFS|nr:pleckstrin domain-containing protein [Cavenderia fasciculata]EGG23897.1 pleckstrin domain-containing protein [Cavenderia fasciculata]|eukprot:XP_004361748.1 pleckstrin domain-containing protein [Cavenderia fasciculata]
MKFKFCGELDAPDWLLREISTLSKITNIRIKLLTVQIINSFSGEEVDFEKVEKLVKDSGFLLGDIKALIAALHFIIFNGVKNDVDDSILSNELQQLGLPKEHCDSISRAYRDNKDKLRAIFKNDTLKLPALEKVDWRVDYLLSSNTIPEVNQPNVQLNFTVKDPTTGQVTKHPFEISAKKFNVLYYELKSAKALMETSSSSSSYSAIHYYIITFTKLFGFATTTTTITTKIMIKESSSIMDPSRLPDHSSAAASIPQHHQQQPQHDSSSSTTSGGGSSGPNSADDYSSDTCSVMEEELLMQCDIGGLSPEEIAQKKERLRNQAVLEFVKTETSYVRDLKLIGKLFIEPVKEKISQQDYQDLFGCTEKILNLHRDLLVEFEAIPAKTPQNQNIGEVLSKSLNHKDFTSLYVTHCKQQATCNSVFEKLKNNSKTFSNCIENATQHYLSRGLSFHMLIIKPVQRITKYPLLLKTLLENTPIENTDYKYLQSCSITINNVLDEVNNQKRLMDEAIQNRNKLKELESTISTEEVKLTDSPIRKFVKEGLVSKGLERESLRCILLSDSCKKYNGGDVWSQSWF